MTRRPLSEKSRLLAVASPEEWDWWLSYIADWMVDDEPPLFFEKPKAAKMHPTYFCFFCIAYCWTEGPNKGVRDCLECMPKSNGYMACTSHSPKSRVDRAIARLERAGIWEE